MPEERPVKRLSWLSLEQVACSRDQRKKEGRCEECVLDSLHQQEPKSMEMPEVNVSYSTVDID
jgi:hypothetical protein